MRNQNRSFRHQLIQIPECFSDALRKTVHAHMYRIHYANELFDSFKELIV